MNKILDIFYSSMSIDIYYVCEIRIKNYSYTIVCELWV